MAAVEDPNLPEVQEEEGILEEFFRNINDLLDEAENTSDLQGKELTATRLESVCNVLMQILPDFNGESREFIQHLILNIEMIKSALIRDINNQTQSQWFAPCTVAQLTFDTGKIYEYNARRGRPKVQIPQSCLLYLRESGFSWNQIADMFLVSKWTILRRAEGYGLQNVNRFSEISDEELNSKVLSFLLGSP